MHSRSKAYKRYEKICEIFETAKHDKPKALQIISGMEAAARINDNELEAKKLANIKKLL